MNAKLPLASPSILRNTRGSNGRVVVFAVAAGVPVQSPDGQCSARSRLVLFACFLWVVILGLGFWGFVNSAPASRGQIIISTPTARWSVILSWYCVQVFIVFCLMLGCKQGRNWHHITKSRGALFCFVPGRWCELVEVVCNFAVF